MIDISQDQRQTIQAILKHHVPDYEVRAFGSRFTWTAKDYSDLDLAIVGPGKLSFNALSALKTAFEESDLPYRVDVLDWHALSPEFQKVIEQGYEVLQKSGSGMSSEGWKKYKLVEIADVQTGPFGSQLHQKDYVPFGIPIITVEHLGENHIVHENLPRVSDADKQRLNKYTLREGDIVFSRVGSVDRRALVKKDEEGWLFSGRCLRVRPTSKKLNAKYLSYYFGLNAFKKYIRAIAVGSTMPSLNTTILSEIEIPFPPFEVQRRIADILSALDEKIELNRQTNATLEAIAQTIFKEWFVDFNFPGETGKMMESELGMIPSGWRVGRLGDVCNVTMGQSPPGESYNETGEGIPFHQGRTDFGFRFPTQRVFTIDPKRFAKQFDTLVSVRAPVGDMNIAKENCCIGRGLAAVIEKNGKHTFTYYFLKELTGKFKNFEDNGTVFGSINKTDFENMPCIVPNDGAIDTFEDKCRSIDESIFNNEQESSTLAALRNALLPKLMRGEIEV